MFKRFMIGFLLGIGIAYYYLHHGGQIIASATRWADTSAGRYRGDSRHQAANEVLGDRR
jgi:hypothetical protein